MDSYEIGKKLFLQTWSGLKMAIRSSGYVTYHFSQSFPVK